MRARSPRSTSTSPLKNADENTTTGFPAPSITTWSFAAYERILRPAARTGQKQGKGSGGFLAPIDDKKIASGNKAYKMLTRKLVAGFFNWLTARAASAVQYQPGSTIGIDPAAAARISPSNRPAGEYPSRPIFASPPVTRRPPPRPTNPAYPPGVSPPAPPLSRSRSPHRAAVTSPTECRLCPAGSCR